MCRISNVLLVSLLFAVGLGPVAQATVLSVSIDTSALSGTPVSLAFDLVDGDGILGNNSVAISDFFTDAALGSSSVSGGVSGSLPAFTLTDSAGFNELLQFLTLGASINFTITLTDNYQAGGTFLDQFALYILDGSGLDTLFSTNQPSAENALLAYEMMGTVGGRLQVYSGTGPGNWPAWSAVIEPQASAAEPPSLALCGLGGVAYAFLLRRRNSRTPSQ